MPAINVGSASATPGSNAFGTISVCELPDGSKVELPIGIINGSQDGPRLWLHAVHGDEYFGLALCSELFKRLDAKKLRGALIALPVMNLVAFRQLAKVAAIDGADISKIWPGTPVERATYAEAHTELVVHAVFEEIKKNATHVFDVHDGGIRGKMALCSGYYRTGGKLEEDASEIARAMGTKFVLKMNFGPGSIAEQTSKVNIPCVLFETGGEGRVPDEISTATDSFIAGMKHLGMLQGEAINAPEPIVFEKTLLLRAHRGGVVRTNVELYQRLSPNQTIANVYDLFGRPLETIASPSAGVVLGFRTLLPTFSGEWVCTIGVT
jgi:hypothetical protein